MQKNSLIKKIRLISKFLTSESGEQTITISILPSIKRSKDNQTVKLGQSIECNMRNIFREKLYKKCGRGAIPRPFSRKSKWTISLD